MHARGRRGWTAGSVYAIDHQSRINRRSLPPRCTSRPAATAKATQACCVWQSAVWYLVRSNQSGVRRLRIRFLGICLTRCSAMSVLVLLPAPSLMPSHPPFFFRSEGADHAAQKHAAELQVEPFSRPLCCCKSSCLRCRMLRTKPKRSSSAK